MKETTETAPAIDRTFLNVLENHRNGELLSDVSVAIRKVASAMALTQKGGKVTITLNMKPTTAGDGAAFVMEPDIKITEPKMKPAGSIFYCDDDFNLVRENPRQKKLNLREVEPSTAASALREVGDK